MFRRHISTPCTYIDTFFFDSVYDDVFCYPQWMIKTCLLRNVGTNVIDCDLLFISAEWVSIGFIADYTPCCAYLF